MHFHCYLLQDLSGCKTDKFEFDDYFEKWCDYLEYNGNALSLSSVHTSLLQALKYLCNSGFKALASQKLEKYKLESG